MNIKNNWSIAGTISVFSYIIVGAGYELISFLKTGKVQATLPLLLLSAFIFLCRVGYARSIKDHGTIWADFSGLIILTLLTIFKIIYK